MDLQGTLDGHHRAVDAGAVAPGVCEQDASALIGHDLIVGALRRPIRRSREGREQSHALEPGRSAAIGLPEPRGCGTLAGMSRQIPEPIRAYVGLAATVLDEARKLPEALPGLPVRAIGLAMQTALKVQQQWSGLVARGDEVLTGLRGADEPGLATFDDDIDLDAPPAAPSARASAFDRAVVHEEATADDVALDDLTVADTAAALDETDAVTGSRWSTTRSPGWPPSPTPTRSSRRCRTSPTRWPPASRTWRRPTPRPC